MSSSAFSAATVIDPRPRATLPPPLKLNFTSIYTFKFRYPHLVAPCPCSAKNLETESNDGEVVPSLTYEPSAFSVTVKEGGKDRRRAVRIAWEKLVRWSRSWRSRAKSDVLERTKKVQDDLVSFYSLFALIFLIEIEIERVEFFYSGNEN